MKPKFLMTKCPMKVHASPPHGSWSHGAGVFPDSSAQRCKIFHHCVCIQLQTSATPNWCGWRWGWQISQSLVAPLEACLVKTGSISGWTLPLWCHHAGLQLLQPSLLTMTNHYFQCHSRVREPLWGSNLIHPYCQGECAPKKGSLSGCTSNCRTSGTWTNWR